MKMKVKEYTVEFESAGILSDGYGCNVEILAKNKNQAIDKARDRVRWCFRQQKAKVVGIREIDINNNKYVELLFVEYFDVKYNICSSKKEREILELKFEKLKGK